MKNLHDQNGFMSKVRFKLYKYCKQLENKGNEGLNSAFQVKICKYFKNHKGLIFLKLLFVHFIHHQFYKSDQVICGDVLEKQELKLTSLEYTKSKIEAFDHNSLQFNKTITGKAN